MMASTTTIKTISININSLISHEKRLSLTNILKTKRPHICFISETRLHERHKPSFDGYNLIRNDDGRGTAIVIEEKFKLNKVSFHSDVLSACLGSLICRNRSGSQKRILLGSIYIPSCAGQNLSSELDRLLSIANTFDAILLGGDFNARHPNWGDTASNFNGNCISNWFYNGPFLNIDLISPHSPTFPRSSSILDFFMVSCSLNTNNSICNTFASPSDHYGIEITLNTFTVFPILTSPTCFTSFKNTNWDAFRLELHNSLSRIRMPTGEILPNAAIDDLIREVNGKIVNCVENHSITVTAKNLKYKNISMLTRSLLKIRSIWLRKLKRIFHRHLNRVNAEYQELSAQIQCLNKIIKERVKMDLDSEFRARLKKTKPCPQAFKEIDKITGRKYFGTDTSKDILTLDGEELADVESKLNAFKQVYSYLYSEKTPNFDMTLTNSVLSTVNEFGK